jgi:hypothetical protein
LLKNIEFIKRGKEKPLAQIGWNRNGTSSFKHEVQALCIRAERSMEAKWTRRGWSLEIKREILCGIRKRGWRTIGLNDKPKYRF